MDKKKKINLSKISRQLLVFHIFLCSKAVEMIEIKKLIVASNKTLIRDMGELQNAGLISIKFSRKYNGYIHTNDRNRCPFAEPNFSDNKAKNMHLEKLIRLAKIMIGLRNHNEVAFYEDGYKDQVTCSSWYREMFPNLSKRTMQRDFKELNKIGYEIKYDSFDKYYYVDFPEGLDEIERR